MTATARPIPLAALFGRFLLAMFLCVGAARAGTHHVQSASQVEAVIASGDLSAGDTIIWADGEFADEALSIDGLDGTAAAPITLRAASPGGVILRGESQLRISAQWWVIEGFHFDGSSGGSNAYNAVQFRGRGNVGAQNVRLSNCALTNLTIDGESSKWIQIYGRHNTIDHCHFSGKSSKGALITVELGYLDAMETAEHTIEWNYFADFAPQDGTDNETIRVGYSGDQNKPATCLIQHNCFVRCNGENEIISNKSSYNTYYANTFRQCDGSLVLRHGHHARVEGNFFFGEGADNTGGIRIVDSHHVILNNYMQDLTGTTWNSALSILGGHKTSGGGDSGYQAVDSIVVAHNSIINCARSIYLNDAKGSRAPTGVIANNLVSSSTEPLILEELSVDNMQWIGNLLHGAPVGAAVEAIRADPLLKSSDGLFRPGPDGPAADAAISGVSDIHLDMDGQSRPESNRDIGADEVAGAHGDISLGPLGPDDVGVSFLRGRPATTAD